MPTLTTETKICACDGCEKDRETVRFDGHDLCTICVVELTTACRDCGERIWRDDAMSTGRCFGCQRKDDAKVRDLLDERLEEIVASGGGWRALEVLRAAKLID